MAREITYNNFEISLVVFMSNITTNHAITNTNSQSNNYYFFSKVIPETTELPYLIPKVMQTGSYAKLLR